MSEETEEKEKGTGELKGRARESIVAASLAISEEEIDEQNTEREHTEKKQQQR